MAFNPNEARDSHGKWTGDGEETVAYHGTTKDFTEFKAGDPQEYMIDRALGPHFAKDPEIANSFVIERVNGRDIGPKEGGRIIPVTLPSEDKFLVADQPKYDWAKDMPDVKEWQARTTDQSAIEKMVAKEGFKQDPAMLQRYLEQARAMTPDKAAMAASDLVAGKQADVNESSKMDLDRFVNNFGGKPYNDADRARMVDLARASFQAKGYKGIKYINTSPMENAKGGDPTAYIVFDPKDVKPHFSGGKK